ATPAVKRNRHPKVTQPAKPATVEKQVEPVVQVKTDLKPQEPDIKQQRISKTESPKSVAKTNAMEKSSMGNSTAGQLLQEGRVKVGLSIEQVSISTKIKKSFIESLERDDFENLPAAVYVNAYTRALCSLYNIDDKLVFSLLNKVKGKNLDYTVPEEVILQLEKGKQVNIVQENKVKRMVLIGFAACLALSAFISITYYFTHAGVGLSSSTTEVKPAIDIQTGMNLGVSAKTLEEDMEKKLMPPHVFTMTSLPLAER
ncbi:MAG: helix-turn-helix transcriptional regulator, partial [Lentisphaerae bacterium]|nr:helix-turn-helix transcriptional regulator [Lentisphaerota bacterium]